MTWRRIRIILFLLSPILLIFLLGCNEDGSPETSAGCCSPFCVSLGSDECSQRGGSWSEADCSSVEQCKKSCCTPFCAVLGKEECTQRGGTSSGTDCASVDDCKKGCCMPFCSELTKAECGSEFGYGGEWNAGSCREKDDCQKVCCKSKSSYTFMTKVECRQAAGEEQAASECGGCCLPYCVNLKKSECDSRGGTLKEGIDCSNVDDCKKGCCTPFCTELTKAECGSEFGYGGQWNSRSCNEQDECRKGCCMPFCSELTKSECSSGYGYGGQWNEGSCQEQKDCKKICCTSSDTFMTKTECLQAGGKEQAASECDIGPRQGTVTIEITNANQCDCRRDQYDPEEICRIDNNIVQKFTATYAVDTNPSKADWNEWYFNEADYFLKGTGTYTVIGTSTKVTGRTTSTSTFDVHMAQEAHLIITKTEEVYAFFAELPQTFTYVNTWSGSGIGGTEEREADVALPTNFAGNLSGAHTFHQWPLAEDIPTCEDYEGATGTITWSFE